MAEVEAILDERHRGESFIIALWGGTEQEMETKAFLNPFSERFDVEIIVSGPPQYAQIEAMAQTGNLLWDVVLTSGGSGAALGLSGALEELDCSVIDRRDWVPTMQSLPWFGGGGETFSYGLMYSTETYPDGGPQPSGWTAYLDTDKFPGRRGLHGDEWFWKYLWPTTLAVEDPSLIATQEGRDSLARLTDEQLSQATELVVDAWLPITDILYTGSETCNQLLLSGDLDMCAQSVGRALAVVKEGLPIKTSFDDGHVASTAGFNVVKGHKEQDPHKFELLQLFNAWINFPEIAADVARGYAYGPYNLAAAEFMVGPDFEEALPYASTGPILGPTAIVPDFQWQGELGSVMVELWLQLQTQAGP